MSKYRLILTIGGVCAVFLCNSLTIPKAYALAGSTAQGGSNAQAVHAIGETGENVNVGLMAGRNVRATHEAFYDKDANGNPVGSTHVSNYDFSGNGIAPVNHDTWVAGIVVSRGGVSHPYDIGVAPGVDIHCARVADNSYNLYFSWLDNALDELITAQNCRVIVTAFSLDTSITADGQSDWTLLYDYYAYNYDVIFADAAGNDITQIPIFGDAYNGVTTGGLNGDIVYDRVGTLSGAGPTVDGRRKPDVVAPSQNQTMPNANADNTWTTWTSGGGETSLSMPHTAGVAALLLGLADDTTDLDDNRDEIIRAVIVNSAFPNINDRAGDSTNPADINNTWNPYRGYGRVDALRAYQLLGSNRLSDGASTSEQKGWAFDTITPLQQHTYSVYAPSRSRLVATLAWNRRVQWLDKPPYNGRINEGELASYLADLDLRIYEPNNPGDPIFSKTAFGYDPNDNLIKCDILLTVTGQYAVRVVNSSTGETADYGLAFELLPPLPGDFDLDYIVDYNDLAEIAEDWLSPASGSDVDLSGDGFIDFYDFAPFADNWLTSDHAYH
ncbi:MAG: S8 family serine peptidase [Sedimentisphaerales bacterium]|nr:S8 family serine peptidase [Sedimentisphaerales bacterium]